VWSAGKRWVLAPGKGFDRLIVPVPAIVLH